MISLVSVVVCLDNFEKEMEKATHTARDILEQLFDEALLDPIVVRKMDKSSIPIVVQFSALLLTCARTRQTHVSASMTKALHIRH